VWAGEQWLTRVKVDLLLSVTIPWTTLALVERRPGKLFFFFLLLFLFKKAHTSFPCRVALPGVHNDLRGTFPLPLRGPSGASGCASAKCTHVNPPWCQRDFKGSFRCDGYVGSEPTEHTAGHPAGLPGFGESCFLGRKIGKPLDQELKNKRLSVFMTFYSQRMGMLSTLTPKLGIRLKQLRMCGLVGCEVQRTVHWLAAQCYIKGCILILENRNVLRWKNSQNIWPFKSLFTAQSMTKPDVNSSNGIPPHQHCWSWLEQARSVT